ncbi:MAG: cyclic nucleotide-binding domain-containing protein [Verrucomicrobia bacterium]|nr:cyclic nucleotide-binding domain-containing protein [Verrucomicrobiota bacterium]
MNSLATLADQLRRNPALQELEEGTLRALAARLEAVAFAPGEVICREGEVGDRMFLIAAGEVSVLKTGERGEFVEITVLRAGDLAGELSLIGPTVRSATLRARGEAQLWVLSHEACHRLLAEHPPLARALLAHLGRHLRRETSTVARLLAQDADRRFKVVCFDTKPYIEAVFRERNHEHFSLRFIEARLTLETVSLAAGANGVCAFVNDTLDASVLEELSELGVGIVALRCVGYDNVDLAACARHGLAVTRVPTYSPHAVAEHAVALMLTLNRRTHRAHNRVREGNFSLSGLVGFDLYQKTAGIIGTGQIGQCTLRILAGFGCRLLAYDLYPNPALTAETGVQFVPLPDLLARADIVSVHAPLTPQSRHLINAAAIQQMKPGVMLINTSRGALIDTAALLEGLKSGRIGYAGLDVYEGERPYFFEDHSDRPLADDLLARLTTFNNVLITGHQAFLTREALRNIADTTLANLREFEAGRRGAALTHRVPLPSTPHP